LIYTLPVKGVGQKDLF